MNYEKLKDLLDSKVLLYNNKNFIENDPISIPHRFSKNSDIEIAGFFAAILAWGNRKTIINNCNRLMQLMDFTPYDFIVNHSEIDLKKFDKFVHRTFNSTDLLFFIEVFKRVYKKKQSLETLFLPENTIVNIKTGLISFHNFCFDFDFAPQRTKKHISTPLKNSACKRLNMYLRWMVRNDNNGVDFGIWKKIKPSQLVCPLDVHVIRTSNSLSLLNSEKGNWQNAEKLTENLKLFDANDPVKYDFALFGMGIENKLKSH
ncbi:MAG: TIGR02757 family protein [Bacteroidetes bacterium]|nr:TIGR02757 family protein [Bacteroidota bacterium]